MTTDANLAQLREVAVGGSVALPAPSLEGRMSVEEATARRRSVREYAPDPLTLAEISQLLWSAQGLTSPEGLRAAPSAGARYPLETYLACAEGLFRYEAANHTLVKVNRGDLRGPLAEACLGQSFVQEAAVSIIFAAVYGRTTSRYSDRGIRYVHIDVGHAAQNVHLQAEALGLASVPVGAFKDDFVARALALPGNHSPIYVVPVGHRRG